jgi:hypothetical protein
MGSAYAFAMTALGLPHAALLNEILLRLVDGTKTDGWECRLYGELSVDGRGASQWVTFREPSGHT